MSAVQRSDNVSDDVKRIDISRVALVEREVAGVSGPDGTARIVTDRPGLIVVDTVAIARQLLVVTERFHGAWRAEEGGARLETARVYGDFLGCIVEPGRHRVTLRFAPASAAYGLSGTAAGLALTVVATFLLWPGRRQDAPAQDARVGALTA
jgi:hypothetical protein